MKKLFLRFCILYVIVQFVSTIMIVKAIKHEDIYEEIYEKIEDLFNHEEIDSDNYEETYFDTLEIDSVFIRNLKLK